MSANNVLNCLFNKITKMLDMSCEYVKGIETVIMTFYLRYIYTWLKGHKFVFIFVLGCV